MVPEKVKSKPCIIWTNFWQTRRTSSPPPPPQGHGRIPVQPSVFSITLAPCKGEFFVLYEIFRGGFLGPHLWLKTFNLGFQFLGASVRCPVCHSTSYLIHISNYIPKRNKLLALHSSIGSSLLGSFEGNLWSPPSAKSPRKRENALHVC